MAEPDPLTLYADAVRPNGWCLRSALVRYAQPEAKQSTVIHGLMRRLDAALASGDAARRSELAPIVDRFVELADAMTSWAGDRAAHVVPPTDELVAAVTMDFERLDVPEEQFDPAEWKGMRSSEGRRPPKASAKSATSTKSAKPPEPASD